MFLFVSVLEEDDGSDDDSSFWIGVDESGKEGNEDGIEDDLSVTGEKTTESEESLTEADRRNPVQLKRRKKGNVV